MKIDLPSNWSFAFAPSEPENKIEKLADLIDAGLTCYPCTVPGNFELDLAAAGIVEGDPFWASNMVELRKYETYHVWYSCRFNLDDLAGNLPFLCFEGIDCFSDIFLNGTHVGSTDNMLILHEFDASDCASSDNELVVHIHPASEKAKKFSYPPAVSTMPHLADSTYVRKAPHSYGWDIMPRALSAGIWRPLSVQLRPPERIDWVYLATTAVSLDCASATLRLMYRLEANVMHQDVFELQMRGQCGESTFQTNTRVLFVSGYVNIEILCPELWWPAGSGAASLYDVELVLLKNGKTLDSRSFRHGIRWVELDRTDVIDDEGHGEFCFRINHQPVFVKGTNWVPADPYHSRDVQRIPRMLELAQDLHCNMIRCWGGNVYENDLFFDLCDEKGIMVWQDFAMACCVYPQDAEFSHRLELEATAVVQRLRQHASLVLWAGDNECDESWMNAGMGLNPNDNVLTRKVLPNVLRAEDPFRPYLPSSPYVGPEGFKKGFANLPEAHLWGVRHNHRDEYYKHTRCNFISEIGFLSCPASASIRKFIPEESLWPFEENPCWLLHCTSPIPGVNLFDYRIDLLAHQVEVFFGSVPDNLEDFVFATQAVQAEGMKFIIERFRCQMWKKTGVLWWNLIDGWPQFSDSVVDHYFEPKLAFSFVKRAQEPLCLSIFEEQDGSLKLIAANDQRTDQTVPYQVVDVESGTVALSGLALAKGREATVLSSVPDPGRLGMYQIRWEIDGKEATNHFLYGKTPYDLENYRRLLALSYTGGTLPLGGPFSAE